MKKKIGLFWVAAMAAVTLTGCLNDSDNSDYEKVRPVEPGLYIYSAASSQNEMALQPAGIALRFAILRSEAEKQGKLDNLDMVFVSGAGNVKTLLFGANTKITGADGVYEISYAGAGGTITYDSYARVGTVRITTGGNALEETSELAPWRVSLVTESLIVSGNRRVTLSSTGGTAVYRKGDGYEISVRSLTSYIDKRVTSDWTGTFVWTPVNAGDLSFSALKDTSFGWDGSGSGATFWTFNNSTPVHMSYAVAGGKYDPSTIGTPQIIGGVETCALTDPKDYDEAGYPSPDVKLTWTLKDKRLSYVVDYNGNSVEFNY